MPRYRRFLRRHLARIRSVTSAALGLVAAVVAVKGVDAIYPPAGVILSAVLLFLAALAIDNEDPDAD